MAFDSRHTSTHSWTAPNVWGTAPPKSPTQGTVSSFLGQEYTPSSPPSSRSRPRSLTLLMNPFSSSSSSHHHQSGPPLQQIDEEPKRAYYPTLNEVLHNTSPPPYTLSSFMAFLSTMHSLETLEFLLDASRYRSIYQQIFLPSNQPSPQPSYPDIERVKTMWLRLIDAYVRPGGSREVNLPCELRDSLLRASANYKPPSPELLDPSVSHIYNLMRDGVLASFIASCDSSPNISSGPTASKSDLSFSRSLWNKSPAALLNRNSSGSSATSTRSSSTDLMTPTTSFSSTSQPISIPYPMSPHRSSFPPSSARSMGGFLSQSIANNLEDSHLDSWFENTSDEMSDVEDGSLGRKSSSGRNSPMTPPLTPPPQGDGSPIREGGMWSRRVREKFRLRKN
jgi:Regulator of G protein signaling domain